MGGPGSATSPRAFAPFRRPRRRPPSGPWVPTPHHCPALAAPALRPRPVDVARRASGCGSFGVRDWLVVLVGRDPQDALFLELKAQPGSCWRPTPGHRGQVVAQAAQVLQTWSDPFLGWSEVAGEPVLVRQWSDHKASLDLEDLRRDLVGYAHLCGRVLAKAQARAGDGAALRGYAGSSGALDEAIGRFASAYAEQVLLDFQAFGRLLRGGDLPLP